MKLNIVHVHVHVLHNVATVTVITVYHINIYSYFIQFPGIAIIGHLYFVQACIMAAGIELQYLVCSVQVLYTFRKLTQSLLPV